MLGYLAVATKHSCPSCVFLALTIDIVRYDQSATLSCTISMRSTHQYLRDRLCSGSVTILFGGNYSLSV